MRLSATLTSMLLLVTADLPTTLLAFAPSAISARRQPCRLRVPPRFYQQDASENPLPLPQPTPRVSNNEHAELAPSTKFSSDGTRVEPKLVLPSLSLSDIQEQTKKKSKRDIVTSLFGRNRLDQKWKSFQKWTQRPGAKFRLRLGAIATAIIAVVSLRSNVRIRMLAITKHWVSHRGFQGIAALGRSVAYLWALLVGYPRMLDRRAKERQRKDKNMAIERRRVQLDRLAGEVARLRQELTSLDGEIRAFRREIISLKAYARRDRSDDTNSDDSDEIQKAINTEMGHLLQLRTDTKAALDAARQTWAEFRSKSPPEIWDDTWVL